MTKRILPWLALLALFLGGCQTDLSTKAWAVESLKDGPWTVVPGILEMRYAENRAIAFSMLSDVPARIRTPLIFGLACVSLAALLAYAWTLRRRGPWRIAPLALILAGAVGNIIDRYRNGYVVDFVRVHWHEAWSFAIFNVADSLITVGLILAILQGLLDKEPQAPDREALLPEAAKA
jgi:signal peptidase II